MFAVVFGGFYLIMIGSYFVLLFWVLMLLGAFLVFSMLGYFCSSHSEGLACLRKGGSHQNVSCSQALFQKGSPQVIFGLGSFAYSMNECLCRITTGEHWTGSPNKSTDQTGEKCPKNVRKLCWQCLWTIIAQFFGTFFRTFCRYSLLMARPTICPLQV